MKYLIFILSVFAVLAMACEPEEEKLTFDSSASLRFSTDTVLFDTVFTSQQSITKRLRVYNDNEKAVNISDINIANGTSSSYKVYVNGKAATQFEDITLFGKDSLLILVEVTIDPMDENLPFIVTDELRFNTNGNLQDIKLVAWGQDAVFLNGEVLACNTTWTADRPYVIFNSVLVDSLCNLTVEAGAKIYSHKGSFILVEGTLEVRGTAEERVAITNDRFDATFENAPGQWGGIIFLQGSKDNIIEYADIRNAEFGVYLGTPDDDKSYDLIIGNSRIENMGGSETFMGNIINVTPGYGILSVSSDLYAYNTLVNNCAINVVGNYAGGNYRYENCTFVNFSFDFFREDPAVVLADNIQLGDNSVLVDDLQVNMINTIIWGSLRDELTISGTGQTQFDVNISHSLLKTTDQQLNTASNILNEDPEFVATRLYDYQLDTLSPAKDAGRFINLNTDLEGNMRDSLPDLGAFERIEN
ncbi:right-handed parallel beta-helix repeat-containing protein [Fulvivirga sp. RKSG066]|uniref:right-handed parallel beta-helix repeat-containing protein n=1 Tax=Fulvivirga aurantia TaxID=2529383 RepID=UPI0012BD2488|nr:right-handed parallel beta-helix repeat-containing protein [Fulvivirga aurantia]MTI22481.1 right-handed parallel beta-helix repeat-containing protein [Fulvivirga aurantia]